MIRHGRAGGGHHAVRIDCALIRDGLLQGRVAIGAVAVDFQLFDGDPKLAQWKRTHTAGGEIKSRAAVHFRPVHVIGTSMSHRSGCAGIGRALRLQYKYTGMPASRIIRPMAEFAGKVAIVVMTIAAQARTKRAVV